MGWSNYLIVPEIKTAFEISRSIEDDLDQEVVDEVLDERETFHDFLLHEKINDLTMDKYNQLINGYKFGEKVHDIFVNNHDNLLVYYFIGKSKKVHVISEFKFEEDKKKYKGYKIVPRYLGD